MAKYAVAVLLLLALMAPCFAQGNPAETVPFDHWAYDAVQKLVDNGIIIGYPDGTFRGNRAMTRYEFAMAISRMLDVVTKTPGGGGGTGAAGTKGAAGEPGPVGPQGPAGVAGEQGAVGPAGTVDDAKVQAIVKSLLDEFKNELATVRDDLQYVKDDVANLGDRVGALEAGAKRPKAFGWVDYRVGLVSHQGPYFPGGPRSDLDGRDSFDSLTAKFGIQGQVTDALTARVALKVRDASDRVVIRGIGANRIEYPAVDGYRSEQIWLDEACLQFNTNKFPRAQWTAGRFFQSYGPGLLVNNERKAQQGVRMVLDNVLGTPLSLQGFGGFSEPTGSNYVSTAHDAYVSARAELKRPSWRIGGNWLADGMGSERGWSADIWARIFGNREIWAEYAKMTRDQAGNSTNLGATAPASLGDSWGLIAAADILKTKNLGLRGFYSDVQPRFSSWYSTANPYYEFLGYADPTKGWNSSSVAGLTGADQEIPWERWLRNPLAMANLRVIGGQLDFRLASMPVELAYYKLRNHRTNWTNSLWPQYGDGTVAAADRRIVPFGQLWALKVSREVADGVNANLTVARQVAEDGIIGLNDQNLVMVGATIGF